MVEVSGHCDGATRNISLGVFAVEHGEVIPAILPSVATQMILQGEISAKGIVSMPDWLPRQRFVDELTKRRINISVKTDRNWLPYEAARLAPF